MQLPIAQIRPVFIRHSGVRAVHSQPQMCDSISVVRRKGSPQGVLFQPGVLKNGDMAKFWSSERRRKANSASRTFRLWLPAPVVIVPVMPPCQFSSVKNRGQRGQAGGAKEQAADSTPGKPAHKREHTNSREKMALPQVYRFGSDWRFRVLNSNNDDMGFELLAARMRDIRLRRRDARLVKRLYHLRQFALLLTGRPTTRATPSALCQLCRFRIEVTVK